MKTLIRWGATLGLVASTILCSGLYQSRSAFALPQEEIFKLLRGIPVFMLVNDKNVPLGGKIDEQTMFTNVFMSKQNAHEFLIQLKKDKPSIADQYKVELISLGAIYEVSQKNSNESQRLALQYIPTKTEVESAKPILSEDGKEYRGGVPLYILKGGPEQNYLTIKQDGETIIPIFFENQTIQQVINNLKQQESDQATNLKIEVILLGNLIGTLEKEDNEFFRKIRLWPSQEMMKIIQENRQN
ncbi:Tic22 family protein [cyanobacterium endosymbiont of Epithemia turgida]|uniref:Tic22 family protein n=1 Tax=cyanobacterium endosymbiont of Epithemia turgida TaxID=718217 RepID=UPI0004D136FE|nr:Tic22 family protein [cyanobacterium endosymbiont of Epithemia turgida]BAP17011.1 putative Tic22-like protein [cyanobacterium endosymbiont of Epithemia turgida isolate EtSB Lake Yunoko]